MLTVNNVLKNYQKSGTSLPIFKDASFAVHAGEFVALRGPSGCGKSTMLLLAGGLMAADQGTLSVNGTELSGLDADERAAFRNRNIGFVFQEFHLIPYLSVLQNVLAASDKGFRETERAKTLLERFSLWDRNHHYPSQLSTGERQRAALARALLNEPKLLLADEPTGNLDAENAGQVLKFLREYADDGGSVLLVTHDDRAAEKTDRVLTIKNLQIQ